MDNALKTTTNGACTFGWSITTLIVGDNHQSAGSEQGWRINGPVPEKCFVDANFNATVASLSTCVIASIEGTCELIGVTDPLPLRSQPW